jgi:hypothetical protein
LNNRLFVGGDVSLNSRLIVYSDVSLNNRLFVGGDVSLNSRLFLNSNSLYVNGSLFTGGGGGSNTFTADVSMNNRLFVGFDASINGNLYANIVTCNELLIVNTDLCGGYLFSDVITASAGFISVSDASFNSRLSVGGDVSLNGNLFINNYAKFNRITENIANATFGSTITLAYSSSASLYYVTPTSATNFTVNFTGLPTDPNQTFVCTLLINTGSTNRCYGNVVQIGGIGKTLLCNGGIANVSLGSCTFVSQSFVFVNAGGSAPVAIMTNIVPYQ